MPTRVFVVDDSPTHLLILEGILRAAGYTVEAFDRPEALLARLSPASRGCVVMDLQMPGLDGLALQKAFSDRGVLLPVIFVSGSAGVPEAVLAMKQGAVDFLTKPVDPAALAALVASAMAKDAAAREDRAAEERARASWAELSARERDVCRLSARGLMIKQIAAELGVTESTAQAHRARGMAKLSVGKVVDLIEVLRLAGEAEGDP